MANPYPNNESYRLRLSLPLNYTLYFFDPRHNSWISHSAGPGTSSRQLDAGSVPVVLQGNDENLLYLKITTNGLQRYGHPVRPAVILEKEIVRHTLELRTWIAWLICLTLLLCFCCYNLYVYWLLQEKVYRAYLWMQVGALVFITAFRHFFSLLPFSWYNVRLNTDGSMYCYDLNAFLLHTGAMIIVISMMQLCRFYLDTAKQLPAWDRLLQGLSAGYAVYVAVPALLTISRIFYLDNYTLLYDNIFVLVNIAVTLLTCVVGLTRKLPAARHFLVANALPFLLGGAVAAYFIVHSSPVYTDVDAFLPEVAILSQVITFGVALLARLRALQEQLRHQAQEMNQLAEDMEQTAYKHMLLEQEHKMMRDIMRKERHI